MAAWGYTKEEIRQLKVAAYITHNVYDAVERHQLAGVDHPDAMEWTNSSAVGRRGTEASKETTMRQRVEGTPGPEVADNGEANLVPNAPPVISVPGPYTALVRERQGLIDEVVELRSDQTRNRRIITNLYAELAKRTAERNVARKGNNNQ